MKTFDEVFKERIATPDSGYAGLGTSTQEGLRNMALSMYVVGLKAGIEAQTSGGLANLLVDIVQELGPLKGEKDEHAPE